MPRHCTRCSLYRDRKYEVIGRGDIPARILFIGEAPGKSENVRGLPFIGPSGKLLREAILATAECYQIITPTYYITNIIRCIPWRVSAVSKAAGREIRPPTAEEALACQPNLERVYKKIKPARVIFLGAVAARLGKTPFPDGAQLRHPAYILRRGGVGCGEYLLFVRQLAEIFREVS